MVELGAILGIGIGLVALIIIAAIVNLIFWLVMFIDAIKKNSTTWIIIFIIGLLTGLFSGLIAFIYWLTEWRKK